MNKSVFFAAVITTLILSGCQSLEDQIGNKIAEGIINTASNGEVKVKIDDLEKGKMNITTKEGTIALDGNENGGDFKVTDSSGKTVVEGSGDGKTMSITGEDGKTATISGGEGEGRPADAPADLPSPNGATDFSYFSADTMSSLSYTVSGSELVQVCDAVRVMLTDAGWAASTTGMRSEDAGNIVRPFEKDGYALMESCSLTNNVPDISLIKTKKNN